MNRAQLEKEMEGLQAKLRWTHIPEGLKETYRARIAEIRKLMKRAEESTSAAK